LRRAAWRAQHANRPRDHNIETINLTRESDGTSNPECANPTKPQFTTTDYIKSKSYNFLMKLNNIY